MTKRTARSCTGGAHYAPLSFEEYTIPSPSFRIGFLADHPQHAGQVSGWIWQEWMHHRGWTHDRTLAFMRAEAMNTDTLDLALIAIDDKNGECIGTIGLMRQDCLPGYEDRGPWIGDFYVAPSHRNRQIGTGLYTHTLKIAAGMGIDKCYVHSSSIGSFFRTRGARELGQAGWNGNTVTIFEILTRG